MAEEKYLVRLDFIKRVNLLHFGSILIIGALSMLRLPIVDLKLSIPSLAGLLVALCLVRISTRATRLDVIISCSLLPVLLLVVAFIVKACNLRGYPLWGIAFGLGSAVIYSKACGRDFSFVGQYLLALITSSSVLAVYAVWQALPPSTSAFLLGVNALYLLYYVYDSASLLARRRVNEEAAAVVDLYRDVFNIFGYVVRVARHWKKHRIWAPSKPLGKV